MKKMKEVYIDMDQTLGGIKIIDGIYIGDIIVAQNLQFIANNSINFIVNCAEELPEFFSSYGIKYYNLDWNLNQKKPLFSNFEKFEKFYNFVSKILKKQKTILFSSVHGINRAFTALIAYLIRRYFHIFIFSRFQWSVYKCIKFCQFRCPGLLIPKNFKDLLRELGKLLGEKGYIIKTYKLENLSNKNDLEEVMIMNTIKNSFTFWNKSDLGKFDFIFRGYSI